MERKGIETDKGNYNREIRKYNQLVKTIKEEIKTLKGWIGNLLDNLSTSYLRKNNIETIGQLQTKIETLKSNSYRLNKKAKTIHKEMEDVEKKILYYEIYKAKKEVYEEYQKKNIFTKEAFSQISS